MPDSYSIGTVKAAWKGYKTSMAWRCQKNGVTTVKFKAPDMHEGFTKVTMCKVSECLDFPTYLEKVFS